MPLWLIIWVNDILSAEITLEISIQCQSLVIIEAHMILFLNLYDIFRID